MAKKKNKSKKKPTVNKNKPSQKTKKADEKLTSRDLNENYLWSMSGAPSPGENTSTVQLIPAAFFTAFVIMIVRLHSYTRDMSEYYWSSGRDSLSDFFSYYKVVAIIICVILVIVFLLYRLFSQNFYIKKSILYVPALVYVGFVLLSFAFSAEKDIAWMGWNDRFEGTLVLMCYIFMVFYIMNLVNSERGIKIILYPLAVSSFILSLLGLSQALDKDFFRTSLGQKLIVPNSLLESGKTAWETVDQYAEQGKQLLEFTFKNREIYQTVYNINYVSFYLTLLLPIFGLLFIQEKKSIVKKIIWGVLFALLVFNLIGSASSGGLLGMFVVVVLAIVLFNKKIISWWKPMVILIAIVALVGGLTYERWVPELSGAVKSAAGTSQKQAVETPADGNTDSGQEAIAESDPTKAGASGHKFDYFKNEGNNIKFSLDGNVGKIDLSDEESIIVTDNDGRQLNLTQDESTGIANIADERFNAITIQPTTDEDGNSLIAIGLNGEDRKWSFTKTENGVQLLNDLKKTVKLDNVEHWGFDNNPGFGSGRGYIWSRSLPMIKDTLFIGHGADTYCVYFPHKDYVGKYNAEWNINMVVDKPHNMFIGIATNTGLISLIALLTFFGIYIVQSFRLYFFRREIKSFTAFAGAGIFLGICGFLVSGFVNDSSVSVMPMFYGLLGTGIATNMLLKKDIE